MTVHRNIAKDKSIFRNEYTTIKNEYQPEKGSGRKLCQALFYWLFAKIIKLRIE